MISLKSFIIIFFVATFILSIIGGALGNSFGSFGGFLGGPVPFISVPAEKFVEIYGYKFHNYRSRNRNPNCRESK